MAVHPVRPEDFACWVALHAAGIPGRARGAVIARTPCAALADGQVGLRRFDPIRAVERARAIVPFVEGGGRILGAADEESLGLMGGRRRAPLCAFARGDVSLTRARPMVAVVGSRDATVRGLHWTRSVVDNLVRAGAVIVSGGARGVDQAAHEAALAAGGRTIAILGDPVRASGDDERPRWMREPFDAARGQALSLTVYGPWVEGARNLFAARNHWIAAMADAVILVEGREGSGTRHTAEAARSLRIPLWSLAGDFETSRVPNAYLEERHASWLHPHEAARQVLGRSPAPPCPDLCRGIPLGPGSAATPVDEPAIVRLIRDAGGRLLLDEAARRLRRPIRDLLRDVALLELDGLIRREGPHLVASPSG